MHKWMCFLIVCSLLATLGCISAPQPPTGNTTTVTPDAAKTKELPEKMEFPGGASDESLLGSMQGAQIEAIRQGVIFIIGEQKEKANQAKLMSVLYNTKSLSGYVELIQMTRKDKVDDLYVYEGTYNVKLRAIESTLKAQGIIGSDTTAGEETPDKPQVDKETVTIDDVEIDEEEYEPPTADEKKFIASYVNKMTFIAFFNEASEEDVEIKKAAVASINEYLIGEGKGVYDYDQVEKIKEDNRLVFEEEAGETMSITQWVAQKLNADVYVEIDGSAVGSGFIGGKYTATANFSIKAYDASTGDLVGQAVYNLPQNEAAYSKTSKDDARIVATRGTVFAYIMPRLLPQIVDKMKSSLLAGIKYDVIIQNPPNDRILSGFWKNIKRDIESYKLIYQSEEEVKYSVWLIGGIEELKTAFYGASESVTQLADMYLVLARGKSVTFNSGL